MAAVWLPSGRRARIEAVSGRRDSLSLKALAWLCCAEELTCAGLGSTHVSCPLDPLSVTAPVPTTRSRAASQAEVLEITRGLLNELGSGHAIAALRGPAQLDRDLGLGSLERVELLLRIERVLGIALPEQAMAAAETLDDVIAAVENAAAGRIARRRDARAWNPRRLQRR